MAVPVKAAAKALNKGKDDKGEEKKSGLGGGVSQESREQEAEKSGMEKIVQKPKQMAMKMVKLIMALVVKFFVMMLIKFLPIIIALILISSLFGWLIDDDDDSSSGGIIVGAVGTTTPDSDMTVDPEEGEGLDTGEIESFIYNFESEDDTLKTELKNSAEDIQNWQKDNGYDARILIALAFDEANGATEFDLNEFITTDMANAASAWKEQELTTPREFVTQYICDREGIEPEDISTAQMLKVSIIVNNIGIAEQASGIAGEQEASGDGYNDKYTNSSGVTFINYKQNLGSYAAHVWTTYNSANKTISQCGCGLTSTAIILSGLTGVDRTPLQVLKEVYGESGFTNNFSRSTVLSHYRFTMGGYITSNVDGVLEELKKGNVAMIHVGAESDFTNDQHYMAILDYNEATNQVYLSDPFNSVQNPDGWTDWDVVKKGWKGYNVVNVPRRSTSSTPAPSNAIGVMAKTTYDNAINSTSFASAKVKEDNAFSSGADILTLAECDGKVASFIAISNKGEYIKYNTSKEISYESIIKLPTIYSIAAYNTTATADIKNDNNLPEKTITFNRETKVLPVRPISDDIKYTLVNSKNFEYSRLCQVYIGQNGYNDIVKWLRNPDNHGNSGSYYTGAAHDQDVLMGGAVWGSGTILRPIRWMYAIATNELNVETEVYNKIMNYASQCATDARMTAKSGYTIYQKTGSGGTIHGHDIGIVVNNTTKDFYIYAIMLENDSNDTKDCPKIADEIFKVMKEYID